MSLKQDQDSEADLALVCEFIRGRQQHLRGPQPLAELLSRLFAKRGYSQMQSSDNCAAAWREAVGSRHAADAKAGTIRRGLLEVIVRNSAVMQELTFDKARLLKKLRVMLPDQKIKDIRFRVGSLD